MKLFKKDKEAILDRIDQVEIALMRKVNMVQSDREKRLEEMFFNAKAHKIVEYENQIKFLKSQIEDKDKVIEQFQKNIKFKKSDLKRGDIITAKCGDMTVYYKDNEDMQYYEEDLTNSIDTDFDIVKVERPIALETIYIRKNSKKKVKKNG